MGAWPYFDAGGTECQDPTGLGMQLFLSLLNATTPPFFLYAICYAWGVGDVSGTATPFLPPYTAVLLFTLKVTKFRSASRQDPFSCFRFFDLE
jgi:hypothetical protein